MRVQLDGGQTAVCGGKARVSLAAMENGAELSFTTFSISPISRAKLSFARTGISYVSFLKIGHSLFKLKLRFAFCEFAPTGY